MARRDTLHDTEGLHNTHQTCFHVTTNLEVELTGTGIYGICFLVIVNNKVQEKDTHYNNNLMVEIFLRSFALFKNYKLSLMPGSLQSLERHTFL